MGLCAPYMSVCYRDGPELQNVHLDGDCCHSVLWNSGFCPASIKCCLVTLILTLTPCNWSIIYQASHRNAREGCLLKIILRMKKRFMFSISCLLVYVWDRWIVRKWMTVHTCNVWVVCVHTSWMNTRKERDEDWFNVVLVGFFITFIHEGLMVLSWDIATLILWTSETEEAKLLSHMSDKPQWKFKSFGQNIAFSSVG